VQADGPQRLPRVSLRLCRVDQFWQVNALQ
jgi:hypothetical protein